MSDTIDNRIVSMEFENQEFERRAAQTSKTIDKLDEQLQFKNAGKGFDETVAMMNRADFSSISNSVAALATRFSFFGSIGRDILNELTGSMQNFARQIASTIDSMGVLAGMQTGFSKYENYIGSTQTIQAALPELSIKEIEEQLEQLVWFTDETSYNFTDMVASVGKFTAAGLGLEESITAMEGIANWAAVSGVEAREASRAYYNLSQAISMGKMTTLDWKSIEGLNMATQEFKDAAIDAAINMHTLEVRSDGVYATVDGNSKKIADSLAEMNTGFRDTLKEGWFDTATMMNVLGRYGAFADKVYEDYLQTGRLATTIIEDLGDLDGYELSKKAFMAAQSAKTFHDAIEAVKDAVGSGWMTTFKLMFGNLDEAKSLWSDVVESMWAIFAGGGEGRNRLLEQWHEGLEMTADELPELRDEIEPIVDELGNFNVEIAKARQRGEEITKQISGYEHFAHAFTTAFSIMATVVEKAREAVSGLSDQDSLVKSFIRATVQVDLFVTSIQDNLAPAITRIQKVITIVGTVLQTVFGPIIRTVFRAIGRVISGLVTSIGDFIDRLELSEEGLGNFQKIGEGVAKAFDFIVTVFEKLAWALSPLLDIFGAIGELILDIVSTFVDFGGTMAESVSESEEFNAAFSALRGIMQTVSKVVVAAIRSIQGIFDKLAPAITPTWEALKELIGVIWEFVSPAVDAFLAWLGSFEVDFSGLGDTILRIAPKIGSALSKMWDAVKKIWTAVQPFLSGVWNWLLGFMGNFSFDILQSRIQKFIDFWNQHIWPVIQTIWKTLKDVFSAAWKGLSTEWSELNLGEKIDAAEGVAKILLIVQGIKTLKDSSKFIGAIRDLFKTLGEAITPVKDFPSKILAVGAGLFLLTVALLALLSVPDESLEKMALTFMELGGGLLGLLLVLNKIPGGGKKSALTTIAIAISILVMVNTLIKLIDYLKSGTVTTKDLLTAAGIIGALAIFIGIAMALMGGGDSFSKSKSKGSKSVSKSRTGQTIATVLSILAVMYAVKKLVPLVLDLANAEVSERELITAAAIVGGLVLLLGVATMLGGLGNAKLGTAVSFIALVLALRLLLPVVLAVAELAKSASSDGEAQQIFETAMGIVAGALALLGLIVYYGGISGANFGTAMNFVALALAVVALTAVLAYIVELIDTASLTDVIVAAAIVAALELVTGGMVALAGKYASWEGFASLLAAAVDVVAIGWAISEIGKLPMDQLIAAGAALAVCEGAIGAMILLASLKASWEGFASLLAAAADVVAIGWAISTIGELPLDNLIAAGAVLAACEGALGAMILLASLKASWEGFASLLAAAANVVAIGWAISEIGKLPSDDIWNAGIVLALCEGAVGAMILLASLKASWEGFASLLAAAVDVVAIAWALGEIGKIPSDDLTRATIALDLSLAVLAGMVAVAGFTGSWAGFATLLAAAADALALAYSLKMLADIPEDDLLRAQQTMDTVMLVMAALVAVAGVASGLTGGYGAAATLAAVAAVLLAIGEGAKLAAEAFVIFNQGLAMLAVVLPPLGIALTTFLQTMVEGIDETLHTIWDNFQAWAVQVAYDIPVLAADIIAAFLTGISDGFSHLGEALNNIFPNFDTWLSDAWESIKEFGTNIWNSIKEGLEAAIDKIAESWEKIKTGFTAWWDENWPKIKEWGTNLWNKIKEGLEAAIDKISESWDKIKTGFSSWWSNTMATAKEWGTNLWNKIKEGLEEALDKISESWDKIKTGWSTWWNNTISTIKQWGSDIWNKIKEGLKSGTDNISDSWDEIKTGWTTWWNNTISTIKQWGSDLWEKIKEGFTEAVGKISEAWDKIKTGFTDWWDTTKENFTSFGGGIMDAVISGIGDKLSEIWGKAKEVGENILSGIRSALGISDGSSSAAETAGKNVLQGLINGLKNGSLLSSIWSAAFGAGSRAKSGVSEGVEEGSPSVATMKSGKNVLLGLIYGLSDRRLLADVTEAGENAGSEAVESLGDAISGLYQFAQYDDFDNEIHFTVVLDSDEAMKQLQAIGGGTAAFQALGQMKLASAGISMAQRAEASFQPVVRRDSNKEQDESSPETNSVTYVQNNYSPKSLSRFDIYRQTRAQLLEFKKG